MKRRIMWTARSAAEKTMICNAISSSADPVRTASTNFKWENNEYICPEGVCHEHWTTMYVYFLGWGDAQNVYENRR